MEKAIVTNGLRPKWISIDVWFFCRDITFRATGHMWPSVFCKRVQNNIERVHECHSRLGQVAHYFGYITIGMELLLLSDGFVFALCCFIALLSSSNWTVVSWSDAQWSMTISSWKKKGKGQHHSISFPCCFRNFILSLQHRFFTAVKMIWLHKSYLFKIDLHLPLQSEIIRGNFVTIGHYSGTKGQALR
jgi:hypothetical protein